MQLRNIYYFRNCVKDNYAQSSYDSYQSKMYNHVLPMIGTKQLNELTKFDVQNLVHTLSNDARLSPTSVRLIYCVLHKIINFAVDMELIQKDICRSVKLPKQTRYKPKIYSKADIKTLINTAKNSFLYMVILLAARLGLRRSEILSLRWNDIDFHAGTINIRNGKSKQSIRTLEISKTLIQSLKDYKSEQKTLLHEHGIKQSNETLVVCKADGTQYNPTFISRKFNEFLQTNDFSMIRLHDLRFSFATIAHNNGMPIKYLSKALGHAKSATTLDYYVQINDEYISIPEQ